MKERYVVDTNVLIAASAADPQHPKDVDATPEDLSLRLKIFCWLDEFRASSSRLVFDDAWKIYNEYRNNRRSLGLSGIVRGGYGKLVFGRKSVAGSLVILAKSKKCSPRPEPWHSVPCYRFRMWHVEAWQ